MTKESAAYKAIRRKRRLVVDYRELNRVTVRKFFIIPNSEGIKSTVAGSKYISVGDLKEGFNQVDNELETSVKMAVLSVTGSYLPRGLTFGPVNGPEDFQGLVFEIFARRLYKDHFIFIDDLAVATGRTPCRPPGLSQVADVVEVVSEERKRQEVAPGGVALASGAAPVSAASERCYFMNDDETPHFADSDNEGEETLCFLHEEKGGRARGRCSRLGSGAERGGPRDSLVYL
jgi:hypothetical protein